MYSFFNQANEKGLINYGELPKPNIKITQTELDGILKFINGKTIAVGEYDVLIDLKPNAWTLILSTLPYQTPNRPMIKGALASAGAVRKCSSTRWNPSSISRNPSGPIAIISESPIAESYE